MSNPFTSQAAGNNSFMPEDYVARKAESRVNILILTLFAVVMAAVVGAFMVTNQRWQQLRTRQETVNDMYVQEGKKIEQLKELEKQRAQMMEKAEITAALVEKIPRWAMLGEISLRMPRNMRLDMLTLKSTRIDAPAPKAMMPVPTVKSLTNKLKGDNKPAEKPTVSAPKFSYVLTISGTAEENNDIADFLESLKASPIMDKVELPYIKEARERDRILRKFEVTAVLASNVDTTMIADSLKDLVAKRTEALLGEQQAKEQKEAAKPGAEPANQPGLADGSNKPGEETP